MCCFMRLAETIKEKETVAGEYFEKHSVLLVASLVVKNRYDVYKKDATGYRLVDKISASSMSKDELFNYLEEIDHKDISEFKEGLILPYSDFKLYKESFAKGFQIV